MIELPSRVRDALLKQLATLREEAPPHSISSFESGLSSRHALGKSGAHSDTDDLSIDHFDDADEHEAALIVISSGVGGVTLANPKPKHRDSRAGRANAAKRRKSYPAYPCHSLAMMELGGAPLPASGGPTTTANANTNANYAGALTRSTTPNSGSGVAFDPTNDIILRTRAPNGVEFLRGFTNGASGFLSANGFVSAAVPERVLPTVDRRSHLLANMRRAQSSNNVLGSRLHAGTLAAGTTTTTTTPPQSRKPSLLSTSDPFRHRNWSTSPEHAASISSSVTTSSTSSTSSSVLDVHAADSPGTKLRNAMLNVFTELFKWYRLYIVEQNSLESIFDAEGFIGAVTADCKEFLLSFTNSLTCRRFILQRLMSTDDLFERHLREDLQRRISTEGRMYTPRTPSPVQRCLLMHDIIVIVPHR